MRGEDEGALCLSGVGRLAPAPHAMPTEAHLHQDKHKAPTQPRARPLSLQDAGTPLTPFGWQISLGTLASPAVGIAEPQQTGDASVPSPLNPTPAPTECEKPPGYVLIDDDFRFVAVGWLDNLRLLRRVNRLIGDESLGHFTGNIVVILYWWRLHQVRARPFEGTANAAIQRQFHHTHGIDHHARRVGRVPYFQLEFYVQRHIAKGAPFQADVGPLAVAQPLHVVGRPYMHVAIAQGVV